MEYIGGAGEADPRLETKTSQLAPSHRRGGGEIKKEKRKLTGIAVGQTFGCLISL